MLQIYNDVFFEDFEGNSASGTTNLRQYVLTLALYGRKPSVIKPIVVDESGTTLSLWIDEPPLRYFPNYKVMYFDEDERVASGSSDLARLSMHDHSYPDDHVIVKGDGSIRLENDNGQTTLTNQQAEALFVAIRPAVDAYFYTI